MIRHLVIGVAAVGLLAGSGRPASGQTARLRYVAAVYFDAGGAGFQHPEGIGCDAKGQIVVGDTGNDRLVRFTYQDKAISGGTELKIPELMSPARIQVNSRGEIFALDGRQRRLVRIAPDGAFQGAVTFEGAGRPAGILPKDFAIDSADSLYVLDVPGGRVIVLGADTKVQREIPLPTESGFVSHIAVDAGGRIILLDSIRRRLFAAAKDAATFSPLGGDLAEFIATLPSYLIAKKGVIFVIEGPGSSIVAFGSDGSFLSRQLTQGWNEGSLNHPSQVCINDKDEVFVADRDNSRIQVFQLMR